jgi:Bacterial capsule synthesis protein PGA_cap
MVIFAAVGDVLIDRTHPGTALEGVESILSAADVVFGNFEGVLTDTHVPGPGMSTSTVVGTGNAAGLVSFDVMSLANNHAVDAGYGGLADTIATLTARGVRVVGAGSSLDEALRPAIVRVGELRLAVVACASVLVVGTQSGPAMPGVAPLRAEDCYAAPFPGHLCPGVPAKVVSVLNEHDLARVRQAIEEARTQADRVVVSVHWGDHTRPWVVTEHERLCAELFVDAGADLVLGHHHHLLRGVQRVEATPVFYGLGHIVFDMPGLPDELRARGVDLDRASQDDLEEAFGEYGIFPRAGRSGFPFHPRARFTAVALVEMDERGVGACGLIPCVIDEGGTAWPVPREGARWAEVLDFLRACMTRARLDTQVVDRGENFAGHAMLAVNMGDSP